MFRIQDGRESFYQWDINRHLVVEDASIKQVHYCNRTGDCSLVCPVFEQDGELLACVPNIILQNSWPINVYGYDQEYTKHYAIFKVIPRTRPEDYVYTEEEVKVWSELEQRVIDLEENGIPEETISQKIAEYFVDHPIETGATEEEAAQIEQNKNDIEELKNKQQDLTGYATTEYVDNAVNNLDIPEVDLSDYYTKSEVDSKIPDTSKFITEVPAEYITENELNNKGYLTEHQSLEGYAKTTDIPDVSAYQTEAQVITLIKANMPASGDEVSY